MRVHVKYIEALDHHNWSNIHACIVCDYTSILKSYTYTCTMVHTHIHTHTHTHTGWMVYRALYNTQSHIIANSIWIVHDLRLQFDKLAGTNVYIHDLFSKHSHGFICYTLVQHMFPMNFQTNQHVLTVDCTLHCTRPCPCMYISTIKWRFQNFDHEKLESGVLYTLLV